MSVLSEHLASGTTHVARCWAVMRRDGVVFGFTDHDQDLEFEGIRFRADTGMTARAIAASSGLAVDNSEAMGALSSLSVNEADIEAGHFDAAVVKAWWVRWDNVAERVLQFSGTIGELRREGGAFHAELRGLSEPLNQPQGRVYQPQCPAILGDQACGVDLDDPTYFAEASPAQIAEQRRFGFKGLGMFEEGWFERGRLRVISGAGAGQLCVIKRDLQMGDIRLIETWQALRAPVGLGDTMRIEAGCDKQFETCGRKFSNVVNFRGFPDIPGEDWLMRAPQKSTKNGGSLRQYQVDP